MTELISHDQLEHVARLCYLRLEPQEKTSYHLALNQILEYFQQIKEIDTRDVAPTSYILPLTNVLRQDEPTPSLPREEALANAPSQSEGYFKVPKIL